ncbi:hemagglutinin [Cupriavidus sp. HMR-1]|uniref:M30 family zinc metallopeptidase n=1 Tax=Cupriavidus sp. HMR-1 TaxID=1249621 RepID=UPI0005869984|nr:hemagglutinin [Cupriavidus sp. HMR-1]
MRQNLARASACVRPFPRVSGWTGLAAMSVLALAACGGGGDGGSGPTATPSATTTTTTTTTTPPATPAPLLVSGLDQSCSGCGAASASSYAGAGTGIWGRAPGSSDMDVQYAISGVAGRSISLMLTNLSSMLVAMPASVSSSVAADMLSPQALSVVSDAEATQRAIGEYNRAGWVDTLQNGPAPRLSTMGVSAPLSATVGLAVGAQKSWYHTDKTTRPATLRTQVTAPGNVRVNFWVEDAEFTAGNITQAMVDGLAAAFANSGGIYDKLVNIGGPVWGPNSYGGTMLPDGQPLDIVILNFNRDGQPFGTVGYFWSMHNFLKSSAQNSNEAISLYLDSETLSLGGASGLQSVKTVMAHEGTHMQNFYRRQVSMGAAYAYDTWLEEMTAMQMEDFQSHDIDPTYNPIRDLRLPDFYRYGAYNCNVLQFTGFGASCESYSVSGSLGGFLDRQLGLAFYKDLLTRATADSKTVLDQAIRAARPGWTFEQALLNWKVTTTAALPAASAPTGFGYPGRTDGTYVLPQIDPSLPAYAALRKLPAIAPIFLQGYGTYAAARSDSNGVYSDKVRVPAGAALSVVVY